MWAKPPRCAKATSCPSCKFVDFFDFFCRCLIFGRAGAISLRSRCMRQTTCAIFVRQDRSCYPCAGPRTARQVRRLPKSRAGRRGIRRGSWNSPIRRMSFGCAGACPKTVRVRSPWLGRARPAAPVVRAHAPSPPSWPARASWSFPAERSASMRPLMRSSHAGRAQPQDRLALASGHGSAGRGRAGRLALQDPGQPI